MIYLDLIIIMLQSLNLLCQLVVITLNYLQCILLLSHVLPLYSFVQTNLATLPFNRTSTINFIRPFVPTNYMFALERVLVASL